MPGALWSGCRTRRPDRCDELRPEPRRLEYRPERPFVIVVPDNGGTEHQEECHGAGSEEKREVLDLAIAALVSDPAPWSDREFVDAGSGKTLSNHYFAKRRCPHRL